MFVREYTFTYDGILYNSNIVILVLKMKFFYIIGFLLLELTQIALTLDCYHCEGFIDDENVIENCNHANSTNVALIECDEDEVCIKQRTMPIARELYEPVISKLYLGCGHKTFCEVQKYRSEYCHTCHSNLCNFSNTIKANMVNICFCMFIFKIIF